MNHRRLGPLNGLVSAVVLLVIAMVVVLALPVQANTTITAAKVHSGVEAGDMVRDLLATSPHLRAAVATHEHQGQPLFLDAATVIEAQAIPDAPAFALSDSFLESSTTVYADSVELILIPDAYSTGYWDGTVDARQYDSAGNVVAEYLADVTGTAPDGTTPLTVTYQHVLNYFDRREPIKLDISPAPEIPDLPGQRPSADQNSATDRATAADLDPAVARWLGRLGEVCRRLVRGSRWRSRGRQPDRCRDRLAPLYWRRMCDRCGRLHLRDPLEVMRMAYRFGLFDAAIAGAAVLTVIVLAAGLQRAGAHANPWLSPLRFRAACWFSIPPCVDGPAQRFRSRSGRSRSC